jgi:hypothetical protein
VIILFKGNVDSANVRVGDDVEGVRREIKPRLRAPGTQVHHLDGDGGRGRAPVGCSACGSQACDLVRDAASRLGAVLVEETRTGCGDHVRCRPKRARVKAIARRSCTSQNQTTLSGVQNSSQLALLD